MQSTLQQIPTGAPGLRAKIQQIRVLVADAVHDADFRQMAVEQLKGVRARDWSGEIARVRKFVMRMRFTRDPYTRDGLEVFIHPKTMLLQILGGNAFGDCDDHVLLATAMLEVIGHKTRYRVGGPGRGRYQHIWIDVHHPTKGWVPVELIKPGAPVGWDPAELFRYTESHDSGATTMDGLTITMDPVPGGGPTRQTVRRLGVETALPSDIIRSMKARERRAGVTAEEMQNEAHGLGWVSAAINAVVQAGSAYHGYSQNKRQRRRGDRERKRLMLTQGMTAAEAAYWIPKGESFNLAPYISSVAQSGASLYQEFTYESPTDVYMRQTQAERQPGFVGPRRPMPAGFDRAVLTPAPDWDRRFSEDMARAQGRRPPSRPQLTTARAQRAWEGVRSGSYWDRLMQGGRDLTNRERGGLIDYLSDRDGGDGLYGLGEDPIDPGPYKALTSPLTMPPDWKKIVLTNPGRWAPWYGKLVIAQARVGVEQEAGTYTNRSLGDGFDIETYPGGSNGWAKDWSNLGMLGNPLVDRWMYFFTLTHHPDLLKGVHSGWLAKLKWVLQKIDAPAKQTWLNAEIGRKAAWQTKKDAYTLFMRGKKRGQDRKDAAERARQAAEEAKRRAKAEADAIKAAQEAAAQARREEDRLRRLRQSGRPSPGGGRRAPAGGRAGPPVFGPPAPRTTGKNTTMFIAAAAVVGAAMIFRKKR